MFIRIELVIITCIFLIGAVKGDVYKINYKRTPKEPHNSIVKISKKTVALSEQINVHSPTDCAIDFNIGGCKVK